ncbi:hypothetical protein D3C71_1741440 [compost metagenome]
MGLHIIDGFIIGRIHRPDRLRLRVDCLLRDRQYERIDARGHCGAKVAESCGLAHRDLRLRQNGRIRLLVLQQLQPGWNLRNLGHLDIVFGEPSLLQHGSHRVFGGCIFGQDQALALQVLDLLDIIASRQQIELAEGAAGDFDIKSRIIVDGHRNQIGA